MADLAEAERQHKEALLRETETLSAHAWGRGREKARPVPLSERFIHPIIVAAAAATTTTAGEGRWAEAGHELLSRWTWQEDRCRGLEAGDKERRADVGLLLDQAGPGGRRSALAGVAGVGKTTLLQKMTRDWASGSVYPWIHFLLRFRFRDLNARLGKRTSLRAMVAEAYPRLTASLDALWARPEGLLFTFDGLDEFAGRLEPGLGEEGGVCSPEGEGEVLAIVRGLWTGSVLPGCSLLITGRPWSLEPLRAARGAGGWAEILGFSAPERGEYMAKLLGGAPRLAEELLRHLGENQLLGAMGYQPLGCQMAVASLGPALAQKGGGGGGLRPFPLPKTLTQLMANYLAMVLRAYGREMGSPRDTLLKLGKVALEALGKRSTLLSEEQLAAQRLKASQLAGGQLWELLAGDQASPGAGAAYSFLHPCVQDFLAALGLYLTPPGQGLPRLLSQARGEPDGRYQLFLRFAAGLSSPGAAGPLEELLGLLPPPTAAQALAWLEAELRARASEGPRRGLMEALYVLLEAQSKKLAQGALGGLRLGDPDPRRALALSLMDCSALSQLAQLCEALERLDLDNCGLAGEGLGRLAAALHRCTALSLKGNKLGDQAAKILATVLKKPKCKLQTVVLVNTGLTEACAGDLAAALASNGSLTSLQLGENGLGDRGLKGLCLALRNPGCNLQRLGLDGNGLTESSVDDLASALGINRSLTELDLSNNKLGDGGLRRLSGVLQTPGCKLQALELANNDLTDVCAGDVSSILTASQSLISINLDSNKLGDLGIQYLCRALRNAECRIQTLGLASNGLTDRAAEDLASSLGGNRTLVSLDLRANVFSDRSASAIQGFVRACASLREIRLKGNRFTGDGKNQLDLLNEWRPGLTVEVRPASTQA